jgi:Fe-S cluster assembly protein SufD
VTRDPASLLDRLAPVGPHSTPARRWLEAHGLPSGREEAWRYTPVAEVLADLDEVVPVTAASVDLDLDELAGDFGGPQLVFVNGAFAEGLSRGAAALGPAARFAASGPVSAPLPDPADLERYDGFQALNHSAGRDVAIVTVAAGATVSDPIHIVHVAQSSDGPALSQPRTVIQAGDGSTVTIIETYAGTGSPTMTNASTHISLGVGAVVTHHRIQDEPTSSTHIGHTRVDQRAGARLHSLSMVLGGAVARHALDVTLLGPGAHAALDGVYLPAGTQRHDNVVTVDHASPGSSSVQRFKGVIADEARGSFGGHVIVRHGADGTDARQSNRNLLLSRTAQADTRPWLEILADDVRCAHGATVGRLDEEALFYLRSRGIALADARAMLVAAFVAEITDAVAPAAVRERLELAVARRIGGRS